MAQWCNQHLPAKHQCEPRDEDTDVSPVLDHHHFVPRAWGSRFRTASRYDSSRSWPEMQSKTSKDYLGAVGTIERLLIGRYRPNFVRNKTVQNFQLIVVLGTFDT